MTCLTPLHLPQPLGLRVLRERKALDPSPPHPKGLQAPSPQHTLSSDTRLHLSWCGKTTRLGRSPSSPRLACRILLKHHCSSLTQRSLLREALDEEGKDTGDFWSQGGRRWEEEGFWGTWCHILPLSEALGVESGREFGRAWGCGLGEPGSWQRGGCYWAWSL